MPAKTKLTEVAEDVSAVDETVEATPAAEEAAEVTPEAETVDAEKKEPEPAVLSGQAFLDAFGDKGGVWFAQGKSFDEANRLFMADILTENEELKQRLSAATATGETEPIEFDAEEHAKNKTGFASKIKVAGR